MTYLHTSYKNMAVSKMHWTVSCENKQQYDLSLNMQSCLTIPVKDETSDILNKRGNKNDHSKTTFKIHLTWNCCPGSLPLPGCGQGETPAEQC